MNCKHLVSTISLVASVSFGLFGCSGDNSVNSNGAENSVNSSSSEAVSSSSDDNDMLSSAVNPFDPFPDYGDDLPQEDPDLCMDPVDEEPGELGTCAADISHTPEVGEEVQFKFTPNAATSGYSVVIYASANYEWDYGDGTVSQDSTKNRGVTSKKVSFDKEGVHHVTVTVTMPDGFSDKVECESLVVGIVNASADSSVAGSAKVAKVLRKPGKPNRRIYCR